MNEVEAKGTRARHRKTRVGVVTSDKMQKTVVVEVERRVQHARYGKFLTRRMKYKAHDEKGECKVGDRVRIEETRPISRDKRWRVVATIRQGERL